MSLIPNIRQVAPPTNTGAPKDDVIVEIVEAPTDDAPEFDDSGNVLRIRHGDDTLSVSLDGKPIEQARREGHGGWFENLVEKIGDGERSRIAEELVRGIQDDLDSRREWVEEEAQGIRLMGLKLEVPGVQGAVDGAPVEGMSKVRHPLLQEAVLRFQANARSELLPTDGPAKIRDDSPSGTNPDEDALANALEKDINHYLTVTASEYIPDTDRMLLMLGLVGTSFKKVYFCPLRNRPVSETVDADDLIVNNNATDLRNAKRVTHRLYMRPSVVKRMQILGVYADENLSQPMQPRYDASQEEKKSQQGVQENALRPEDRDREIYECYCELDLLGMEHRYKGKETGLEIPYRVTIDVSSKKILSVVRNYDEDDEDLPTAKVNFVKYTFVPGFGFYDIGLLNILGNSTNAVTAAWREMLDRGMYANFPGFLIADVGARQNTNMFRVAPGSGATVKTGGQLLKDMVLPLPYSDITPGLMNLTENIVQTGQRVGGTAELQVGEGRSDAPVGTILAMIDQATKVMSSVHKRMHAAQAQELRMLVECFREHPKSFWQRNKKPAHPWDEKTFLAAIDAHELTPQADPNTASSTHRIMKYWGLKSLQGATPQLYDPIAVDTACLRAIDFSNPEQFFAPPSAMANPQPKEQKDLADAKAKETDAQAKMTMAQARAIEAKAKAANLTSQIGKNGEDKGPTSIDVMDAQTRRLDAVGRLKGLAVDHKDVVLQNNQQAEDRHSREKIALLSLAKEQLAHRNEMQQDAFQMRHEASEASLDRQAEPSQKDDK